MSKKIAPTRAGVMPGHGEGIDKMPQVLACKAARPGESDLPRACEAAFFERQAERIWVATAGLCLPLTAHPAVPAASALPLPGRPLIMVVRTKGF
jgi:hypothetical protein